ncbi:MAG: hypothetical protein R3E10_01675 [Gemmatimonadota bacterium]
MARPDKTGAEVELSREVSNFLVELSIAVHRYAMYPPDHPSLAPMADALFRILRRLLEKRPTVSLGIANRQLVIDGVATDQRNPVLQDLARRLHMHQLGALVFDREISVGSLQDLFAALAAEAERGGSIPIGLRSAEEAPKITGVRLVPVGYDALQLENAGGQESTGKAMRLWLQLAQAATASQRAFSGESAPQPEDVADSIRQHQREAAYDQVIVGYLLQLADNMRTGESSDLLKVRENISRLIKELDDPTLRRLLEMGGDLAQRHTFISQSIETLGEDAIMKLLRAAAEASGQEISHGLVRLLTKLAFHAREGEERLRPVALDHLRAKVDELMSDWTLPDANAIAHTRILDELSRSQPLLQFGEEEASLTSLAILQMALEVDAFGPMVEQALDAVIAEGDLPEIIPLIEGAHMTETGRLLRARLGDVKQIEAMVGLEDVGEESLALLVNLAGPEQAIPALLRVLADAPSRSIRRKVLGRLIDLGSQVGRFVGPYLEDQRWYVVRNLLSLLARVGGAPPGFSADPFLRHPDVRVQREALPLALADDALRPRALIVALSSGDERMLNVALVDLQKGIPETVLPVLVEHLVRPEEGAHRVSAVRLLGTSRSPLAKRALRELVDGGRGWFGRRKLREATPEMLEALAVLARRWPEDGEVGQLVQAARRSRSAQVRSAVVAESAG